MERVACHDECANHMSMCMSMSMCTRERHYPTVSEVDHARSELVHPRTDWARRHAAQVTLSCLPSDTCARSDVQ